jgi:hypothetical protein
LWVAWPRDHEVHIKELEKGRMSEKIKEERT